MSSAPATTSTEEIEVFDEVTEIPKIETLNSRYLHFLETGDLSDITFVLGKDKTPIKAHKWVLILGSEYFQEQLTNHEEGTNTQVEEPAAQVDPQPSAFQNQLDFHPNHTFSTFKFTPSFVLPLPPSLRSPGTANTSIVEDVPVNEKSNTFVIGNVEPADFRLFLKFMYTGIDPTDVQEALPLLNCATKFNVPSLAKTAGDLLKTTLAIDSALIVFLQSLYYKNSDLQKSALEFICQNGSKIMKLKEWNKLTSEALALIAKEDNLRIYDEMELYEAVLRWGKAECKRQKMDPTNAKYLRSVLEPVLRYVRFPQMVASKFSLRVARAKILTTDEMVDILPYFNLSTKKRSNLPSEYFNATPRKYIEPPNTELKVAKRQDLGSNTDYTSPPNNLSQIRFKASETVWISQVGLCPASSTVIVAQVEISITDEEEDDVFHKLESSFTVAGGSNPAHVTFNQQVRIAGDKWYTLSVRLSNTYKHLYNTSVTDKQVVNVGSAEHPIKFKFRTDDENIRQVAEIGFHLEE